MPEKEVKGRAESNTKSGTKSRQRAGRKVDREWDKEQDNQLSKRGSVYLTAFPPWTASLFINDEIAVLLVVFVKSVVVIG